ncbi:SKOR [Symbiodinium sp. CCMP2592]|nr:SKOR [Symbiodinium sp. CCMP2592]
MLRGSPWTRTSWHRSGSGFNSAWLKTELKNRSTELERREWIKTTAIPALAQTPLLGGSLPSFFHSLAVRLKEQAYKPDSLMVKCGEKLESMMIFIQALLAERVDLETGEEWAPIADSEPSGPFFGVLAAGRVMVEIGPDRHIVLQLTAGAIFPKGLLATYGAVCRAETYCEAYCVRWHDFSPGTSVGVEALLLQCFGEVGLSTPAANDWQGFWKFRVREKAPHAMATGEAWKDQRGRRMSQAKRSDSHVIFEACWQGSLEDKPSEMVILVKLAAKKSLSELKSRVPDWEAQGGLLAYSGGRLLLPKLDEKGLPSLHVD